MKYGLSDQTLAEIRRVLSRAPAVQKAILYGSRAQGNYRAGSDVDLALVGPEVDDGVISQIADQFEDGPLPYRFDLSLLHRIRHQALLDHIARVGIALYDRETATAATR
jgi:predicted nucleotidyltransferase